NNFANLPISVENNNNDNIPMNFVLYQNYPNPFNPSTMIKWSMPRAEKVTIKLFDMLGREIETIVDSYYEAGNHSTLYIANSELSSGVYFYQLKTETYVETKKMIVLK
ncbi:MAG: T9SS type A sorting domain-containing protein, partial [Ignavibacterium sp.]|uniref:T9SS type A sorting domain-containing protein n=1 Tax=Ignavibacterium sp. TaxID=2651167 RepID=UPI0040490A9D